MATQPFDKPPSGPVSVEEYLATAYEPDCEYDDGVIVERKVGEFEHSYLQTLLATLFTNHSEAWNVYGLTEQRIQIAPTKFLIPDLCVLRVGDAADDIISYPPLVVIEILSPEDTIRRAAAKISQYLRFGIENVWVIEPTLRVAYRGTTLGLEIVPAGELKVAGTPILVRIAELFEKLDRIRSSRKA